MDNLFIVVVILIYVLWLIYFVYRLKHLEICDEHIKDEVDILIEKKYIEAVAFKKAKNHVVALQRNLRNQIYCIVKLAKVKDNRLWECLDFLKDTVDLSDMTFYVGNAAVNMLLREKVRECYYKNIALDVVADVTDITINSEHLFFIFSDVIDMAISYIENNRKDKENRCKIIIRASKKSLKVSDFFVLQIAYNILNNNIEDLNMDRYINKHHQNMMQLLLLYNGTIIGKQKENKIVKTITIPLYEFNDSKNKYIIGSL